MKAGTRPRGEERTLSALKAVGSTGPPLSEGGFQWRLVRTDASPRHVPDDVIVVTEIPRTRTGKLLEVPVKKALMGRDPERTASRDVL